ncbi:MAG: glycosyl transferase family 1 [Bacteroidetes bacterium HGW-Bacteroidetes-6]|jgi:glycosyltransferase involved in cell wall biosynthesis|nr:MAG: glycosyl transferase family 1 [Bacteroidetes bacterium HGW-Bacteroidetes-6]
MPGKPIKVIYVISRIDKAFAFEWIAKQIDRSRFDVRFVLLNEGLSQLGQFCAENNIPCKNLHLNGKKSYPRLIIRLFFIFLFQRPKVVHAHLIDASLISLTAAWLALVPKRIYTRHHSTYHFDYFPKAVRWDRWCNKRATQIIAISKNVRKVLIDREGVNPAKVSVVHHGFILSHFSLTKTETAKSLVRKYNPVGKAPVVGVVARFIELKGIQFIIPAFQRLLGDYPNAKLLLFNASGDYRESLMQQLSGLPEGSYEAVVFENDIFSLYNLFDMYVHTPINMHVEAFGQTYVEALAAGVPSVFTLSGVAPEFVVDRHNAIVVPFCNPDAIYTAMCELVENKALAEKLSQNGRADVKLFEISNMINKLETMYGK